MMRVALAYRGDSCIRLHQDNAIASGIKKHHAALMIGIEQPKPQDVGIKLGTFPSIRHRDGEMANALCFDHLKPPV